MAQGNGERWAPRGNQTSAGRRGEGTRRGAGNRSEERRPATGALVLLLLAGTALASAACNSILGNDPHQLAPAGSPEGGGPSDAAAPADGPLGAGDSGAGGDGSSMDASSPGEAVTPTSGGIYSVGRVPDDASVGVLPDGGLVTLTDDGFEFGETLCVDAAIGPTCVTGALSP